LALRLWALGRQPVNADEAVVALMAHGILHGHFQAFYWGQHYGGGEPYVVALLFALFGQSFYVLGLAPLLLDALAALMVFYLGRRLFGVGVGIGSALAFWIWPEAMLWQSTLEYGFRFATLDCGLGLSVVALRIIDTKEGSGRTDPAPQGWIRRYRDVALFGLLLGLGWWCSPEIAYFAVPVTLLICSKLLIRKIRIDRGETLVIVVAATLGALPWLWSNLRSSFASMKAGRQPYPGFMNHLHVLFAHAFPIAAGTQLVGNGRWLGGAAIGPLLAAAVGAVVVFVLAWCVLERRAGFLVLFCLAFPVIYAMSPFTWYWHDARYVLYLPPVLAIVIVAGASQFFGGRYSPHFMRGRHHVSASAVVIAIAVASTLVAASYRSPFNPDHVAGSPQQRWTTFSFDPNHLEVQLASDLHGIGVRDVVTGYWLAYPLDVASRGTITASDIVFVRDEGLLEQVEHSPSPAWVFADQRADAFKELVATTRTGLMDPGCAASTRRCLTASMFIGLLRRDLIDYRTLVLTRDGVEVVFPAKKIAIGEVLAHLAAIDIGKTHRLGPR
jgi:hypothetical protein